MHKKKGAPCEAPFVCGLKAYVAATGAPTSLKEGISKEECEKIVATFKEVGATVEVK